MEFDSCFSFFNLQKLNVGNLEKFKDHVVKLKEGCTYRIKIEFYVQRDIISGLKFVQSAYKGPLRSKF